MNENLKLYFLTKKHFGLPNNITRQSNPSDRKGPRIMTEQEVKIIEDKLTAELDKRKIFINIVYIGKGALCLAGIGVACGWLYLNGIPVCFTYAVSVSAEVYTAATPTLVALKNTKAYVNAANVITGAAAALVTLENVRR